MKEFMFFVLIFVVSANATDLGDGKKWDDLRLIKGDDDLKAIHVYHEDKTPVHSMD